MCMCIPSSKYIFLCKNVILYYTMCEVSDKKPHVFRT